MAISIGFDARAAVLDPHRGLGRVAASLAEALLGREDVVTTIFVPRSSHDISGRWYRDAARIVHLPQPRRGAFLWDGPAWRWVLRHHPVDVLHLPAWGVPPGVPLPVVATLHDVTPLRVPESIRSRRVRRRAVQRLGTHHRATLVHAVSRATARDAVHVLGLPPDRIRVVHNGVALREAREACGERRHVLFVGGADPHKRVDLLVRAWSLAEAAGLPPLVVAGGAARDPGVVEAARRHPDRIRAAGIVDDGELEALYGGALAVLLPSLWEGYGLPAAEGMARGAVPVLTARASLPEAGRDAALYLPAGAGPLEWLAAVRRLVEDRELRARLVERGLRRARERTWERTADALVEVYREAVSRSRSARS